MVVNKTWHPQEIFSIDDLHSREAGMFFTGDGKNISVSDGNKMCFRIWKFPPGTILAEKPLTFVSIETLTECVVFMISREDFEMWIAQDIHLLRLVVHKIAYKLYHSSHNRDARLF